VNAGESRCFAVRRGRRVAFFHSLFIFFSHRLFSFPSHTLQEQQPTNRPQQQQHRTSSKISKGDTMVSWGDNKHTQVPPNADYVGILEEANLPVAVAVHASAPIDSSAEAVVDGSSPVNPAFASHASVAVADESSTTPLYRYSSEQEEVFSRLPTVLSTCPQCQITNTRTRCKTAPGGMTWVVGVVLFFLFWPICWLPFVMDCAKKTEHYCQNCNTVVGTVAPFEDCCVKHRS
jgi:hypothetical protein